VSEHRIEGEEQMTEHELEKQFYANDVIAQARRLAQGSAWDGVIKAINEFAAELRELAERQRVFLERARLEDRLTERGVPMRLASWLADHWPERWL